MTSIPALAAGLAKHLPAQTKLKSKGNLNVNCDECGLGFRMFAAHAKRFDKHYCGQACQWQAKRRQVEIKCVVCNSVFLVKQSQAQEARTCSKACNAENKRQRFAAGLQEKISVGYAQWVQAQMSKSSKLHNAGAKRAPA
jgi:hypothetical protein